MTWRFRIRSAHYLWRDLIREHNFKVVHLSPQP
jgi:hypothetical protein